MTDLRPLRLFEGYGIELEYMIVDRESFAVRPISDQILRAADGDTVNELAMGRIAWSNELVLHVIELKTNGPSPTLGGLAADFHHDLRRIDELLEPLGARLMPSAMHPTMDPARETRLWPHGQDLVYRTYDRIFGCQGHGWANLQSCHLNLPFRGDREFAALHAAVRALLPLLPALAASSPIHDGRVQPALDARIEAYRRNQARIPSIAGELVPESARSAREYRSVVLERIYRDIAPHDPEGLLRHEWLNSRGAIARFDRSAIEIRILDVQEAPVADLAICWLVSETLRGLARERHATVAELQAIPLEPLALLLGRVAREGDEAVVEVGPLLGALGMPEAPCTAGELWRRLATPLLQEQLEPFRPLVDALRTILERGPLARRILARTGPSPDAATLHDLCAQLCRCLHENRLLGA